MNARKFICICFMSSNALLGALPGVLCKSSRNCSGCIFVVGYRVSQGVGKVDGRLSDL